MESILRCFLFLIFVLQLGCFFFPAHHRPPTNHDPPSKRKRKVTPLSPPPPPAHHRTPRSSNIIRSYLKQLFSLSKPTNNDPVHHQVAAPPPSPSPPILISLSPDTFVGKSQSFSRFMKQNISADAAIVVTKAASFASRSDIYPCPTCSEVFPKSYLLDLHQANKHAFTELRDVDSGNAIVGMIFRSSWKGRTNPTILRILKVHNSPKTLARFEEYRESVKSRAARLSAARRGGAEHERCVADGNERLRFYCSTVLCGLGSGSGNRQVGVCGGQYCAACAIVQHGFGGKHVDVEGIATHGTSWGAHVAVPEELQEEFDFLQVRRAMVVCRVVAGRAARGGEKGLLYDSAVVPAVCGGSRGGSLGGEEELLVFNPRALLPCFVIIYTNSP